MQVAGGLFKGSVPDVLDKCILLIKKSVRKITAKTSTLKSRLMEIVRSKRISFKKLNCSQMRKTSTLPS